MLTCQRAGPQKLRCGCVVAEHRSDLGFQLRDREDDLPVLPSDCLQRRALHRFIGWIIAQPWPSIAPIAWLGLGYSALLSIAYGYFVWAHALNTIGVARTSVFNNLTPIVALLAGWLLLGENPVASQIAGVVLVLVGVFIVRSRKPIAIPDD